MFCMFPDSKSEWKKGATGQSFIRKEITTYKIGILRSCCLIYILCPYTREEMCAYECMTELRISPKFSNLSRANKYKSSRCSLGEKATVHNGHLEPWKEKLGRKSSGSALYLTRPVNSTTNWEVRKAILHNDHPKQKERSLTTLTIRGR